MVSEYCYILPEASMSSISGFRLEFPGGTLNLLFDYDRDGDAYHGGLVFKRKGHTLIQQNHIVQLGKLRLLTIS